MGSIFRPEKHKFPPFWNHTWKNPIYLLENYRSIWGQWFTFLAMNKIDFLHMWLLKRQESLTNIRIYSGVHKSPPPFFSKILEKPSIVQKKMIPHINGLGFSLIWSKKKFKMADLENSKWPPQKNLIFQLRQFSIFFHENFMDWSLG